MRKLIILVLCIAFGYAANAQLGNLIKERVKQKTEERILNSVEKGVDRTFDNVEGAARNERNNNEKVETDEIHSQQDGWTCPSCGATGNKGNFCKECGAKKATNNSDSDGWTCSACGNGGNKGKFCNECGSPKPTGDGSWTCSACGKTGNKGKFCGDCGAKQGSDSGNAGAAAESTKPAPKAAEMAYAKSDFVRGDEVFFEDQLVGEQLGEFPSQWDALNGSVEIGKINGENAIMAQLPGDRIAPLFKDMKSYLPEKFTLEFDFWAENPEYEGFNRYIIQLNDKDNTYEWVQNIALESVGTDTDWSSVRWQYYPTNGDDWREGILENIKYKLNSWNHCAISFNKRAMKIYINGVRVANIPNTRQPNNFSIEFGGDGIGRMAHASIKNIVLAKGAVPLYDRMMTDGKFITYGITFDVGKSVVKPESMGEITRIVQLMNENPTLKFSVEGHTDATGNAASNQKLSEARANAIVAKLVENGIAKERLTAVGKGQNNPIADNSTDEGRAKNRRVEFVKQ